MHNPKFQIDPAWRMLMVDLRLDMRAELERAQLPSDLFLRDDVKLAPAEFLRLWQAMEAAIGEPAFAIDLVPRVRHEGFDPAVFAAFCSPDLNTALQRLSRLKPLVAPVNLAVDVGPAQTSVEVRFLGAEAHPVPPSLVGAELVFFVHLLRSSTGQRLCPRRVEAPLDLPGLQRYEDFLGTKIHRGERTRVVFDAADARAPFILRNEAMWQHFEPTLRQRLDRLQAKASTAERVRACLIERLPSGEVGMAQVAQRLLLSTRTLQRRLGDEGTSFQDVLRDVRTELAQHYLAQPGLSGTQIAYLLGFDDPASFSRAYRSWNGVSPEQARGAARTVSVRALH